MLVVGFADVVYSVPVTFTSVVEPNGTRNRISCASSSSSAEILKTLVPLWVPVNVITTNEPNASRVNWLLAATRPHAAELLRSSVNTSPNTNAGAACLTVPAAPIEPISARPYVTLPLFAPALLAVRS